MDDAIAVRQVQCGNGIGICDVYMDRVRTVDALRNGGLKVVENSDGVAVIQHTLCDVRANEPQAAGNDNMHNLYLVHHVFKFAVKRLHQLQAAACDKCATFQRRR